MGNYISNLKNFDKVNIVLSIIPRFIIRFRRRKLYDKKYPKSYISSKAYVNFKKNVTIANEVCIFDDVNINIEDIKIGKYTDISGPTQIVGLGKVEIGNYCSIAPDVYIVTNNHNYKRKIIYPINSRINAEIGDDHIIGNVKIGNDVWIGRGVTILPNVEIGNGCVIAANSVIKSGKYNDFSILGGNPAKLIKYRNTNIHNSEIYNNDIKELNENE
ncbi:MAG: CatB-related O-acetyltransferase [Clostridium sp.]|uniref:CatB-related O-acetyltransferase n=1 Tax=Clostridium sp. TaxID=1506 RepID=UPI003992EE37